MTEVETVSSSNMKHGFRSESLCGMVTFLQLGKFLSFYDTVRTYLEFTQKALIRIKFRECLFCVAFIYTLN